MNDLILKGANFLLSCVYPECLPVVDGISLCKDISNSLLYHKIAHVLQKQDPDFAEWLKMSEKFDKSNKGYTKTARMLINTINAIHQEEMLDIYSNLLHSYKQGLIEKDRFFKLTLLLPNIYYTDLIELKKIYKKSDLEETSELVALRNVNLVSTKAHNKYGEFNFFVYTINDLGLDMLQFGVDLEHCEEYKHYREFLKMSKNQVG